MRIELIYAAYIMFGIGVAVNLNSWRCSLNLRAMTHMVKFSRIPDYRWFTWIIDVVFWPITTGLLYLKYSALADYLRANIEIKCKIEEAEEVFVWHRYGKYFIVGRYSEPLEYKDYLAVFQWLLSNGYEIMVHSSRSKHKAKLNFQIWKKREEDPYAIFDAESEREDNQTVSDPYHTSRRDDKERGDSGEVREDVLQVGEEDHGEVKEGVLPEDTEERA
jgi:hypothetical protein